MEIVVKNEGELKGAAAEFTAALAGRRHVAFRAHMGAGKTTFISAVCSHLGATDDVSSPTFSIINEYRDSSDQPIFHFDFYRIDTPHQALDLGLDEYFDSGALCLMEWPENVEDFLPDDTLFVDIDVHPDGTRCIRM